jgi:hypothetical protein
MMKKGMMTIGSDLPMGWKSRTFFFEDVKYSIVLIVFFHLKQEILRYFEGVCGFRECNRM